MDTALLLITGIVAGTLGSMIGVGGGFIVIPVLLLFFNYSHTWAAATSLTFILINSLVSTWNYAQQKRIDFHIGIPFSIATIPGALVGSYLTPYIEGKAFAIAFAGLLVLVALLMFFKPTGAAQDRIPAAWGNKITRSFQDAQGIVYHYQVNRRAGIAISGWVGLLSSLFGIGGGIIHVPAMTMLLGIPAHIATATSLLILTVSAFFGTIGYLLQGQIQYLPAMFLSIGAIIGAQIGTRLAPKIPAKKLLQLFAVLMFIVAWRLAFA
ncbi:sulfite exporter TauE/SafE family protein [Heliophilum fasciatum]|uniref:Probable membrane transporter protein n=1 Tax=Heliophilum fasciatum TaxID=35700 RepID=A0A4R2S0P7_9FIRM|nr:sulfite exporter TauE/SafE family protein [Heliophilum fasciatum]MCW2276628.1 putative membrane protein YfcA [Heliophilum fasciatum]TCP68989.1 hypothetical protein EDD73_101157 [Heliophilum fasciatum]